MNKEQQITKNNTLLNNLNKAKKTLKKYKSEYKLNKLDIINHILCYIGILLLGSPFFCVLNVIVSLNIFIPIILIYLTLSFIISSLFFGGTVIGKFIKKKYYKDKIQSISRKISKIERDLNTVKDKKHSNNNNQNHNQGIPPINRDYYFTPTDKSKKIKSKEPSFKIIL